MEKWLIICPGFTLLSHRSTVQMWGWGAKRTMPVCRPVRGSRSTTSSWEMNSSVLWLLSPLAWALTNPTYEPSYIMEVHGKNSSTSNFTPNFSMYLYSSKRHWELLSGNRTGWPWWVKKLTSGQCARIYLFSVHCAGLPASAVCSIRLLISTWAGQHVYIPRVEPL